MMAKVAPWKKDRVSELAEILSNDGIVGIVDIGGVPAENMLDMRSSLRDRMTMTMAKKTLIRIAWEQAGLSEDSLGSLLDGAVQPCIVHSESLNSFELFAELDKTRQGRAAKEGEKAPSDIVVEKGPTEFGPGPIVGEFNAVGIPAKIDKGKVAIQKTVTVVNEGEIISGDLGIMLAKLGITPIEIGLILTGSVEGGIVFPASSLNLDLDGFKSDIISATSGAFNLACNTRWFSTTTVPTLLSKASSEAMSVAIEAGIVNDDTVSLFITRANAHAMAISGQLDSSALSSADAVASDTADSDSGAEAPAEVEKGEEE
ncbi:MAG: 50S ribosomal protein L10 [Candidatus Thalassarchaeum sp.]|jgi:large subunit ribosomal protein L10|nr:50S ribosomal protein L10 [Candidatus Thalassarchaeum sp.]|tara:strand:+ start:2523 stop:3470 length:948 start_codon:yes stop_codon:yes gene_type:complete